MCRRVEPNNTTAFSSSLTNTHPTQHEPKHLKLNLETPSAQNEKKEKDENKNKTIILIL
jgi:hypothetical protein